VDERLTGMEEEGLDLDLGSGLGLGGERHWVIVVPEEKRWQLAKVEANLQGRWIRAGFSRGEVDGEGEWRRVVEGREVKTVW
jgi:hypothetical protein